MGHAHATPLRAPHGHEGPAVHLVARVTDTVFSFLGPATLALARLHVPQTVVLIDDPRYRHLLPRFHESVRLVLVSGTANETEQFKGLLDAYCDAALSRAPSVSHLHGLVCCLMGQYAAGLCKLTSPTYFTPHGSKSLVPLRRLGASMPWITRPFTGSISHRVIVNTRTDARAMAGMTRHSMAVIESPVDMAFTETALTPSVTPLVMAGSRVSSLKAVSAFAQCAVLLADQLPGLRFAWMGRVDDEPAQVLKAAGISVVDLNDDQARARHLAQAWVCVAPGGELGFPLFLAEAMALGLPCVVSNTAYQRDLIRDGQTGFLCADWAEVLERLVQLLESHELRRQIGAAAAAEARTRFCGSRFSSALLREYGDVWNPSHKAAGGVGAPAAVARRGIAL